MPGGQPLNDLRHWAASDQSQSTRLVSGPGRLGAVADGQDPARILANRRTEATVAEAAVEFMTEHVEAKRKPNTVASYRNVFDGHIVRKLGRRKLTEITRADIAKFHNSLRSTPHLANYAVAALGSLYTWAGRRGLVPEECNPARRVENFPNGHANAFSHRTSCCALVRPFEKPRRPASLGR